ncbi:uncharacterized protein LOC112052703 [Bicyclus anynana]|uniref:Uncharacterized protein LOC112052703 n=1 Tax=Bicyclus anynana TaxID=110368 RepID=A0A6J1NL38_BICAN|nr:uncharacterized protein LOC112052703 [Bicyclus anynana]
MPLKDNPSVLGNSFHTAKCRFLSLEHKFVKDPVFKSKYVEFMQEYERLGHMTENSYLINRSVNIKNYYIPHHMVQASTSSKYRTVFNASSATSSGLSLNDIQMVGPTVQDDLYSILIRFRQHKYIVTGDIEKMYRAIELNPIQRSLQQIVFRYDSTEPLKTYTLNTLTYGTASAPYLATKCLVSLASSAPNEMVARSIQHDFYVDDFLGGAADFDETIKLCKGVIDTLKSAQFNLRKLKSNNLKILEAISPSSSKIDTILEISNSVNINTSAKTLGLNWISDVDSLSFSISIKLRDKVTKRHILSVISQIFDPLGLVGPCVVEAKLIMQKLWIEQCSWDEEVSQAIRTSWISFAEALPSLNQLKVPRWVLDDNSLVHEVHVFADSSERAYGACLYIRSVNKHNLVTVRLLTSKSRVAPIKPTTIPRLELCGTLLAARLCDKVLNSLTIPISKCRFWCDSMIVLGWLNTPSPRLKSFVRNRVNEIKDITKGHAWSYVPSKDNPADLLSRGLKADSINNSVLWWSGPAFLAKNEIEWPKTPNEREDLPELILHCNFVMDDGCETSVDSINNLIKNKSSFTNLQNIIAYIKRFVYNCKHKTKLTGCLSTIELQNALNLIIHKSQVEMFPDEYSLLKAGKALSPKNRLKSLTPFLDNNDLLRIGGRLDNSPYTYDTKHPILLCSKHHVTKIIFENYHIKHLHAPPRLLLAIVRQTYWPLGGTNLAKVTVNKCVRCFRHKAESVQPIMGQLPKSRTQLEFPFLDCNCDYAGPVMIADRVGRGCKLIKSYVAIFICNSTKACHIELVTALSSKAFIAALNRMIARRGKIRSITSDRGTCFTGASTELAQLLVQSDLQGQIAQEGIEFKFVPSYTPHFNGLAEAAVRSTKHHLKRLLQLTHFTYEEMTTCLAQIEAVLNSRPLTPFSSDPTDFSVLTPAHFLIGRPLTTLPHPDIPIDVNINRLDRFKRIETIKQHFWRRFSVEYVGLLQTKTKWTASKGDLNLGALVLIKDKTLPPLLWRLGRITQLYPGNDGVVRVAEVQTQTGLIRRAFNNICPLPQF